MSFYIKRLRDTKVAYVNDIRLKVSFLQCIVLTLLTMNSSDAFLFRQLENRILAQSSDSCLQMNTKYSETLSWNSSRSVWL